jgi:type IV secretion system protein VirD4
VAIVAVVVAGAGAVLGLLLWLAGQLAALLSGNGWLDSSPADAIKILLGVARNPRHPESAWPEPVRATFGPTWLFLVILLVLLAGAGYLAKHLVRLAENLRRRRGIRLFRLGFASPYEANRLLGRSMVLRKAKRIRPSLHKRRGVRPTEVAFRIGRDYRSRQDLFATVEESLFVVGPPRQGKDALLCVPFVLDAPGPVIVTSSRVDVFLNTYAPRAEQGRVYVFDPNGMTRWPERMRWSLLSGCENGTVAGYRADALLAAAGLPESPAGAPSITTAYTILRAYLHAAELEGRTIEQVVRWVGEQVSPEPVEILRRQHAAGRAAPGWAEALAATTVNGDPHTRALAFANITLAFDCFSDPAVLRECSPDPAEAFDLREFLSGRNTLYILGREGRTGGIAPVVTALVEDLFAAAREIAISAPGGRLDPPLTVELNDAAHITPTRALPMYMGDSGAFSIAVHVYFQSLAQTRWRWDAAAAQTIWENANVRVILGGSGNPSDLDDISKLMGSTGGRRVLSVAEIRTMKFGQAVVVAGSSRPIEARLTPFWKRKDSDRIERGRKATERRVNQYKEDVRPKPTGF